MTIEKVMPIHILPNGVKCYNLEDYLESDTDEAQQVLDYGVQSGKVDADSAYSERVGNPFTGSYEISVTNKLEYNRYVELLTGTHSMPYIPTFMEWKNNMMEVNGRKMRVGKWMKKEYVCDSIIDFYSAQPKTGSDTYYLTISDMPQHIAGMSYYANDWTSCQNPDSSYSMALGGALHDDTLLIAMLHKDMEDLQDMEGKLLARVNMRIVDIEGTRHLLPSRYYGSVDNRGVMDECLSELEALRVHSRAIRYDSNNSGNDSNDLMRVEMEANGSYDMEVYGMEWIYLEVNETVNTTCPTCQGSGSYEVYFEIFEKELDVSCPLCYGEGTYEMEINTTIEQEVEAEEMAELLTYADDYVHDGIWVKMDISKKCYEEHMVKFPK